MAIQQPTGTNIVNAPSHSKAHRAYGWDDSVPDKSVAINSLGNFTSKYSPVIDVTHPDYGAVEGTKDNSSAFQNAANDADSGRIVFIPYGTYLIKDVVLKSSNFYGIGNRTVIKPFATPGTALFISENPSATIENMQLDGGSGDGITAKGVKFTANGWDSALEKIRFINFNDYPVDIDDCNHITIDKCRFEGGTKYMIYGDGADNVSIRRSIFQSSPTTSAIYLTVSSVHKTAHRAQIMENWFEFDNADSCVDTVTIDAQHVSIMNNEFKNTFGTMHAHIRIMDQAQNTWIMGNNFQTGTKILALEGTALSTIAMFNRGLSHTGNISGVGTCDYFQYPETSLDAMCTHCKKHYFYMIGQTSPYMKLDVENVKFLLNNDNDYFGKNGADVQINSNARMLLEAGGQQLRLSANGANGYINSVEPFKLPVYTDATRPDPANYSDGISIWNSDDKAPNYVSGTTWRDASGNST